MKLYALAILVLILVMASCRKNPSIARKNAGHDSSNALQSEPPYDTAARNDSLLAALRALQDSISNRPENSGLIAPLLRSAYDRETGCFYIVGKGTHSASLPRASWDRGRKIAASYDGKRWTLYCKTWSQGGNVQFGKPVSGTISYSKVVFEKVAGDTLFQLLMVPAGSIILESAP
jgi:hypothetical protein